MNTTTITKAQANKVAKMMLEAANYENAWLEIHPVIIAKDGREETINLLAESLNELSNGLISKEDAIDQLLWTRGHNVMEFHDICEEHVKKLRTTFGYGATYTNNKRQQFKFQNGVYEQSGKYRIIDVHIFVDFENNSQNEEDVTEKETKGHMKKYYVIQNENGRYLKTRSGSNGARRAWVANPKGATTFTRSGVEAMKNEQLKGSPYYEGLKIVGLGFGFCGSDAKEAALKNPNLL